MGDSPEGHPQRDAIGEFLEGGGRAPLRNSPEGRGQGSHRKLSERGFPQMLFRSPKKEFPGSPIVISQMGCPQESHWEFPERESQRPPPRRIRKGRSLSRHCEFLGEVPQDSHCEFPEGVARFPFGISTGVPQEGVRKVAEGFPQGSPWEFQEGVP